MYGGASSLSLIVDACLGEEMKMTTAQLRLDECGVR